MKFVETRTLTASKLRSLCIKNDWYTCGDNEDYENLFDRLTDCYGCPVHMTTEKLVEIATDIWEHSEITDYSIETVLFHLAVTCNTFFHRAAT